MSDAMPEAMSVPYANLPRVRIISDGNPRNTEVQVLNDYEKWETISNVVSVTWWIGVDDLARAEIVCDQVEINAEAEMQPEPITGVITNGPSDDWPEVSARVRNARAEISWLLNLPGGLGTEGGRIRASLQRAKEHLEPIPALADKHREPFEEATDG